MCCPFWRSVSRQNCDCRHDLRWKAATTDCKTSTVLDKGFNLVRQLLPVHEAQLRHMQKAEWLQRLLDSGLEAISSSGTLRTAAMMAFSRADGEERLRLFAAAGAAPVAGMLPGAAHPVRRCVRGSRPRFGAGLRPQRDQAHQAREAAGCFRRRPACRSSARPDHRSAASWTGQDEGCLGAA